MTLSKIDLIVTLSLMTLNTMTLSILDLIAALSIIDLFVTVIMKYIQHNDTQNKH
jgi:hypothetical protein